MTTLKKSLKQCFKRKKSKVNDMKNRVLVILATYNGEKYLQEQLDSVLDQDNVQVSILVRDDGSTDSTKTLLQKYANDGKLQWYTGTHLNVSQGYYDLMKKAEMYDVDYIAFCDQDDVWDKDKLEIAIKQLGKVDDLTPALYYSGQRLVDEKLQFIENHKLNTKRTLKTRFVLSDFAGCTGVFNKALLAEVIKFKPEYMLMHDTWILRVCLCLGGTVFIDSEPHIAYRQHSGNTLGLGHSFRATIKQVKQYINEYHIEKLTRELINGYGDRMTPEYRELSKWICEYRNNKQVKRKLLDKKNVDFCSRGLNFTYKLKVLMNKL